MKPPVAERIPDECLLLILDYLWDDHLVSRFIERRSEFSRDYDQMRIHHMLSARAISPIHVCRSWRQSAIRRYFRYVSIGLLCATTTSGGSLSPLPPSARPFVHTLLLQVDTSDDNCHLGLAASGLSRLLPYDLPQVRSLGLCVCDSILRHSHHMAGWFVSCLQRGAVMENHLAFEILNKLPALDSVWFQSTTMAGLLAQSLVRTLTNYPSFVRQQKQSRWASGMPSSLLVPKNTGTVQVSAIHLLSATRNDGDTAVDIIRECARGIRYLCLGKVSGGVLSSLTHYYNEGLSAHVDGDNGNVAVYPQLHRLLFAVDMHVHLRSTNTQPQNGSTGTCPFPALEELYFDHTLSSGLPLEEWYAPLYDVFLKYADMKLKYLTFPIVYNTQRTVSRRNCPELVSLRHIKCCWATGIWSASQADSDSTRVLKAIATIPKLTRYVHPAYIEELSGLPTEISCTELAYLDLYGWPLTLDNLLWILRTFARLETLRVTMIPSAEPQDQNGQQLDLHNISALANPTDGDLTFPQGFIPCRVANVAIGAASSDLGEIELSRLFAILISLPSISSISLYSNAYSFFKANLEIPCDASYTSIPYVPNVRIANLDSVGLSGQSTRERHHHLFRVHNSTSAESLTVSFVRRIASHSANLASGRPAATQNAPNTDSSSNTGWHLIHRLLLGE
ncbi:hypothetical protein BX070DRAFT_255586 [Coemansia spiralis]|nr:hypothetical protein BX070DRAFT_255586 [Coemansia spiralis]